MAFIAYVPWVSGNSDFEILTVLHFASPLFILQMFPIKILGEVGWTVQNGDHSSNGEIIWANIYSTNRRESPVYKQRANPHSLLSLMMLPSW